MAAHDRPGGGPQPGGVERTGDLQLQLDGVGVGPGLLGQRVVDQAVLEGRQRQYAVQGGDRRFQFGDLVPVERYREVGGAASGEPGLVATADEFGEGGGEPVGEAAHPFGADGVGGVRPADGQYGPVGAVQGGGVEVEDVPVEEDRLRPRVDGVGFGGGGPSVRPERRR